MPTIEKLVVANAGQFKNETLDYVTEKVSTLKHLHLHGANLISNDRWSAFFEQRGEMLETLKLEWLDASFDDEQLYHVVEYCRNLKRLRLEMCRKLTNTGFAAVKGLTSLEHLTLQLSPTQSIDNEIIAEVISAVGATLQTLCFDGFHDIDDSILGVIRQHCPRLSKFRLAKNENTTDAGFSNLFRDWENQGLRQIDLHGTRDVDNNEPDGPEDAIGLAGNAFEALMKQSGHTLEQLNIASCRHISHASLLSVFGGEAGTQYPLLREIDISFINSVDTAIIAGIFKSCPKLQRVIAFGCFSIEDTVVPRGIVVVGVPKAQDAIEKFGADGRDGVNVDEALGAIADMMEATTTLDDSGNIMDAELDMPGPSWMVETVERAKRVRSAA